jgi:hypothetical protein
LQLNSDGSFSYTPAEGFFGTDQFVYRSFDGDLSSGNTTVKIEVAPSAVRIRLAATGPNGQLLNEIRAGDPVVLHAYAQDVRDATRADRGIGAVYLDLTFDPTLAPRANSSQLGFEINFGEKYQNVQRGNIRTPGLVDDVGALQTSLTPIGSAEWEVFSMPFDSRGPHAVNDTYRVSRHSNINVFDVLANENGKVVPLQFRAGGSGNSPHGDIVLFEPAQAIFGDDVAFGTATLNFRNSSQLVLDSVGTTTTAGGVITIDSLGRGVRYTPPANYVGTDSFTYTIRDENGQRRSGTVTVQVVDSWSNEHQQMDSNSDSFITTNDVLQIINDLNERGGRKLPDGHQGTTFYDINRDGHATAIDALVLINFLANSIHGSAEGESAAKTDLLLVSEPAVDLDDALVLAIAGEQTDVQLANQLGSPQLMKTRSSGARQAATADSRSEPQSPATRTHFHSALGSRSPATEEADPLAYLLDTLCGDEDLEFLASAVASSR